MQTSAECRVPSTELWLIDAFTDRPFAGNPAGVCWLDRPAPEDWMQAVAREMNQAETAFLRGRANGFALRWFTPAYEVDLCGHATLASAHFLWETGRLARSEPARFHTRSGPLSAEAGDRGITLDFPATPAAPVEMPGGLLRALGLREAGPVLRNRVAQPDYLVVLPDAATVRALRPDPARLRTVAARGIIVTGPADQPGIDFVSRFFAPGAGVDEDPVTGSAHCTLGPYWGERLGRNQLTGYQASARGGTVGVSLHGDRVRLTGRAVTVVRGAIEPPIAPGPGS
jgi:PhzF family phenazine biosynthesis protein